MTAVKPRDFASAGNYPAGSDDWSGQPRIVELSDSEAADGFTPDTPVPAEVLNGLFAEATGDVPALQLHRAMQEWDSVKIGTGATGSTDVEFHYLCAPRLHADLGERRMLYAAGRDEPNSSIVCWRRSLDGGQWDESTSHLGGTPIGMILLAAGPPGVAIFGLNISGSPSIQLAEDYGVDTSRTRGPGFGTDLSALFYSETFGRYVVLLSAGGVETSADFNVWDVTGLAGVTGVGIASYGIPGGRFAESGDEVVLLASTVIGGVSRFRVWRSTDANASWTLTFTGDASVSYDLCRCEAGSSFVLMGSDGSFWRSANGTAWSLTHTTDIVGASVLLTHHSLEACGHVIVRLMNYTVGTTAVAPGMYYSLDMGATWHVSAFGWALGNTVSISGADAAKRLARYVVAANGRLYVSDRYWMYRSGQVEFPEALFTS